MQVFYEDKIVVGGLLARSRTISRETPSYVSEFNKKAPTSLRKGIILINYGL